MLQAGRITRISQFFLKESGQNGEVLTSVMFQLLLDVHRNMLLLPSPRTCSFAGARVVEGVVSAIVRDVLGLVNTGISWDFNL